MIITCPHCQTKYQVTYEAIGSAGRKVQCAHCQQAWQQTPLAPKADQPSPQHKAAFEAIAEDAMDDALQAEERAVSAQVARRVAEEEQKRGKAGAGRVDPAVIRMRQRAFRRRQKSVSADMPLARTKRATRIGALLALGGVLGLFYFGRVQVVERFPDMAGVYEAIGLGVNVVGLDFSNVSTLRTLREGKEVLIVSAQIVGLMPEPVPVPPVVVTLLDGRGAAVYEWSVTPSVRDLMAGERATFDTQLTLPPGKADRVRISFAGGATVLETTALQAGGALPALAGDHAAPAEHGAPAEPDHSAPTEHH